MDICKLLGDPPVRGGFLFAWGSFLCGFFFLLLTPVQYLQPFFSQSVAQFTFLRLLIDHFILSCLKATPLRFVASETTPPSLPVPDQTGSSTQNPTLLKARQ